jgi:hypothetical protein
MIKENKITIYFHQLKADLYLIALIIGYNRDW